MRLQPLHRRTLRTGGAIALWNYFDKEPDSLKELIKDFEFITPLGSLGKSSDVAKAVLFLLFDAMSGHVTGNVIGTDGGVVMGR